MLTGASDDFGGIAGDALDTEGSCGSNGHTQEETHREGGAEQRQGRDEREDMRGKLQQEERAACSRT